MSEEYVEDIIKVAEATEATEESTESIETVETTDSEAKDENNSGEKTASEASPDLVQDDKTSVDDKTSAEGSERESTSAEKQTPAEIEALAMKLGWRKDHPGDDAIDAETYILRSKDIQKTMSKHNKELKSQLNTLNSSVEALKKHHDAVYKAEVKKLTQEIESLKKERRAAVELADVKKVDELDQKIEDKQKDLNAPPPAEETVDNPVFDDWVKENQWYLTDKDMATYAETVAEQYVGAPLDRVYKIVTSKVKEVFPEKFEEQKPERHSYIEKQEKDKKEKENPIGPKDPVESSSAKGKNAGTFTKADLSQDQLMIMRQFVQSGIMTEDQYIADIAKLQGE